MTKAIATHLKTVFSKISDIGFLLESDPKLPSVCGIITGESMHGSWWSHPLAQTIFQVNELLEDHADVMITKLVSGKVTFVHRKLWPEVVSIGKAKDAWQVKTLSVAAKALLKDVEKHGSFRSDQIDVSRFESKSVLTKAVRELELKVLIHADQIHTDSGAHAKILETWQHWSNRTKFKAVVIDPGEAKRVLEELLSKLNAEFEGKGTVPWVGK